MKKTRKRVKKKGVRLVKRKKTVKKPVVSRRRKSIFDMPLPKSTDWKHDWDDDGADFDDES